MNLRPSVSVILLLILPACERSPPEDAVVAAQSYIVAKEPVVRIGGNDSRATHLLQYADAALRLSDGRIVIADAGSREVRFFDASGEHLRTVGGSGAGPGEFQSLRTIMRMRGDTVAAWDASLRRMSVFSPDGEFASTFSIAALDAVLTSVQATLPEQAMVSSGIVYPLSNDRFMIEPLASRMIGGPDGVTQDSVPYALLDRTAEHWIDLGPYAGAERFSHGGSVGPLPFGRSLRFAVGDTVIYLASTYDTEIQVISGESGERIGSIELPVQRRMVSPQDIELYKSRPLDVFLIARATGSIDSMLEAVPWPSEFPAFSSLRIGGDGNLWVQLYRAPTDSIQELIGFGMSGDPVARVTLDASAQVMDVGPDYVLVRVRDELDVEEIRLYELVAVP